MASPNELSFLPEDYLERKARRRANVLCGALSVVVMGTIGSAFYLSERSMRGLDEELAKVDRRYGEAAGDIEAVKRMHAKQRQIVQHAELASALMEKVPRSNLLATFAKSLPPGASLLDLALESKPQVTPAATGATAFDQKRAAAEAAKKPPEPPKFDVVVKLTGVCESEGQVSEYMAKLNRSPLLKDVRLVQSEAFSKDKEKGSAALRKFQLEMRVNPQADVRQDAAPPAKPPAVAAVGDK
ncbi:MAG TPA: PilN domain-containing protein [Humisphaera sp.]